MTAWDQVSTNSASDQAHRSVALKRAGLLAAGWLLLAIGLAATAIVPAALASHEDCSASRIGGDDSEVSCELGGAVASVQYCDDHDGERDNNAIIGACASVAGLGAGTQVVNGCGDWWAAATHHESEFCCHKGFPHDTDAAGGLDWTQIDCPADTIATRVRYDSETGCATGGWGLWCAPLPDGWTFSEEGITVVTGVRAENCPDCSSDGVTNLVRTATITPPEEDEPPPPVSCLDLTPSIDELETAKASIDSFAPTVEQPEDVSKGEPIYSWRDNRGWHHVQVKITDQDGEQPAFHIPRMKASNGIFKKCVRVKYAQQKVVVTVARYDEDNVVSRGWTMRYRTNAADPDFVEQPDDPEFSLPFGITSVSKARHGYKPNSVWLVRDEVTR
jgi:hypothetical protein